MHEDPVKCVCKGSGKFYQQVTPAEGWLKAAIDAPTIAEIQPLKIETVNCKYHHPDSAFYQAAKAKKWMEEAIKNMAVSSNPYYTFGFLGFNSSKPVNSKPKVEEVDDPSIPYPDGWPEEETILWCQQNNYPLPVRLRSSTPYVLSKPYTVGHFTEVAGWDSAKYATYGQNTLAKLLKVVDDKTKEVNYPSGKTIQENISFSGYPATPSGETMWYLPDILKVKVPLKTKAPAKLAKPKK